MNGRSPVNFSTGQIVNLFRYLEFSRLQNLARLVFDVEDINAAVVLCEVDCSSFCYILRFVHFPTKEAVYLDSQSLFIRSLHIECNISRCRVRVNLYLIGSFCCRGGAAHLGLCG